MVGLSGEYAIATNAHLLCKGTIMAVERGCFTGGKRPALVVWPYHYAPRCRPGKETPKWMDLVKEYSQCLLTEALEKLTANAAAAES